MVMNIKDLVWSDLVEVIPAHGRWVGTTWSLNSFPTQTILDSMI